MGSGGVSRAAALLFAALLAGLLAFFLGRPRLPAPSNAGEPSAIGNSSSSPPAASPASSLEPPRAPAQKEQENLETARAPFYALLRQNLGELLTDARPDHDDGATLDLYVTQNASETLQTLLTLGIQPHAYQYGFRHVQFFAPAPPGGAERYQLFAEANAGADRQWRAFFK